MPADLLLIQPHHAAGIAAAAGSSDVVYPVRADGTPGHPVYFSARARELIGGLRDNEPIAHVRDHRELQRQAVPVDDAWPYHDIDRPSDLR